MFEFEEMLLQLLRFGSVGTECLDLRAKRDASASSRWCNRACLARSRWPSRECSVCDGSVLGDARLVANGVAGHVRFAGGAGGSVVMSAAAERVWFVIHGQGMLGL